MDEKLRAIRRRRRRERRLLRQVWNLVPLALVGLAWLLSAGVVKLMESPRPEDHESPVAKTAPVEPERQRPLSVQDTRPELPAMLSTSILDHEVDGQPEQALERALQARPPASDLLLGRDDEDIDNDWSRVPEPGSRLLVAAALFSAALGRRGVRRPRYWSTPSSSTSKVSTAPGGITPGTPVSP